MARADEEIKVDVIDQLYWDDRVDASNVAVEVDHGMATLRGTVPTYWSASRAYEDTWAVQGVTGVSNQLNVNYLPGVTLPTDEELRGDVEEALAFSPDINVAETKVTVEAGVVILEGTVDAFWKKVHAEELVSYLRGVISIENKLSIVPTHDFIDQDIANDMMNALDRNLLVDPENVDVRVTDGFVTLSGTVDSWAAQRAAERIASNTAGVRGVLNELTVTGASRSYT